MINAILCITSFVLLLGTAGAGDAGTISALQETIQAVILLIIFIWTSSKYWNVEETEEVERR